MAVSRVRGLIAPAKIVSFLINVMRGVPLFLKDVLEFDLELSFHFFHKKSNKSSLPGVYATLIFHNVDQSIVLFARGGPRYTHQRGVRVQHARRQCDHRW